MITIKHLQIFVEVAKTKSMSKAAEALYMSQPSISQKISEIESYYNIKLFQRYSKTLGISEEGSVFLERAQRVLMEFESMNDIFLNHKDEITLRIGSTLTVASAVIPSMLYELKAKKPNLNFQVFVDNTKNIEDKLLNNELDLAIVEGERHHENIEHQPIIPDQLALVCSYAHPLAKKKNLKAEDLNGQNFVLREEGSGTRLLLEQFLIEHHIKYHIVWESQSWDAIKQAVLFDHGITLVSVRLVAEDIDNGNLIVLNVDNHNWHRMFSLCYHKNKAWNENMSIFKQEAMNHVHCPVMELIKNKSL